MCEIPQHSVHQKLLKSVIFRRVIQNIEGRGLETVYVSIAFAYRTTVIVSAAQIN